MLERRVLPPNNVERLANDLLGQERSANLPAQDNWNTDSIPSSEAIDKLKNLKTLLPGYKPEFYLFTKTLADMLPSNISPDGFVLAFCQQYVARYGVLEHGPICLALPAIAKAIFPPTFTEDVFKAYKSSLGITD